MRETEWRQKGDECRMRDMQRMAGILLPYGAAVMALNSNVRRDGRGIIILAGMVCVQNDPLCKDTMSAPASITNRIEES